MDWPDYALLAVIAISILVGLWRGLIKEAFSLAVWIAAFLIAYQFAKPMAAFVPGTISLPSARYAMAFGGLFIAVLLVGGLLTFLVGKLVEKTGLTGTDRLLGAVFGAARGVFMLIMIILAAGFTPVPQDPWWQESSVIQGLIPLAEWVADLLPESIREHIDFYGGLGSELLT